MISPESFASCKKWFEFASSTTRFKLNSKTSAHKTTDSKLLSNIMTTSHPPETKCRLCYLLLWIFGLLALELLIYLFFIFDLCFDSCHRKKWETRVGYSLQIIVLLAFAALMAKKQCFGLCSDASRINDQDNSDANESNLSERLVSESV